MIAWRRYESALRRVIDSSRDPLVHFVLLTVLIFAAHRAFAPSEGAEHVIVIPAALRDDLARELETTDTPRPTGRDIDSALERWKREEVMHQEALRLGLDQNDSTIRKHLVAKARELYRKREAAPKPTRAELQTWLDAHRASYLTRESYDFEFVLVDTSTSQKEPDVVARALKDRLVAGEEVLRTRLEKQSFKQIAQRFTPKFATELIRSRDWRALSSPQGWCVARLTARHGGELPEMGKLRPTLVRDWQRANKGKLSDRALEVVAKDYVFVDDGAPSPAG